MRRGEIVILGLILLLGFALRVWFLPQGSLTFGYDQARDAYVTQNMLHGDFKIQGPSANAAGLFHGVLYYYFLLIPYLVGNGSPIVAAYFLALLNLATIPVLFMFVKSVTGKSSIALTAAFLFSVSFESTQYATWLSNPSLAAFTVPLFYFALWLWTEKKAKGASLLAGLALAFSIQSEIFLAYHFLIACFWIVLRHRSITRHQVFFALLFLGLGLATMVLTQLKFGQGMFEAKESIQLKSFESIISLYTTQLRTLFANNLFPLHSAVATVLALGAIITFIFSRIISKNTKILLLLYLFSHVLISGLGGDSSPYITVGLSGALTIIVAIALHALIKTRSSIHVVLLLISLTNIISIKQHNPNGQTIFAVVQAMQLKNQLALIDTTYTQSSESFSINSFTNPLWMNITWSYLYDWYGKQKYGFTPTWHGANQVGLIASLPSSTPSDNYFVIIEPVPNIPQTFLTNFFVEEDSRGTLVKQSIYGGIELQWRRRR